MLRILLVRKCFGSRSLGDRIRIEKISTFLKKNQFKVIETSISSITRFGLWKTFPWLFALHKGIVPIVSWKNFLQWLDMNASFNHMKTIIRKTNPDIVLAETSLVGWVAAKVCKDLSIPCIVDCHGLLFAEVRGMGSHNWQYLELLEEEAFKRCDHLIAVSKKMKIYICQKFKIPPNKITVMPNGGHPQRYTARYALPLRVTYTGSFVYWEKVNDFLDIARENKNPKLKFYMAGDGPLRRQLLERIAKENIPIRYLGFIPREKIFSVISHMHIGVAPSTKDLARIVASPIKVFDYMSSGLPVITPKIGDWGYIVAQEDCGIALEKDDVENYIEALNILTQRDIWVKKSQNAVNAIKQEYNWNNLLKPLVDLLLMYK